jgi:hypothetical protein
MSVFSLARLHLFNGGTVFPNKLLAACKTLLTASLAKTQAMNIPKIRDMATLVTMTDLESFCKSVDEF